MNYPFEFRELLLTRYVLDKLGFTGYHDGAGDYGHRKLNLGSPEWFEITQIDPKEDSFDGYAMLAGDEPLICGGYYLYCWQPIYFLHDLYECVREECGETSEELNVFIEKCKEANCYPHLKSYLEYKEKII